MNLTSYSHSGFNLIPDILSHQALDLCDVTGKVSQALVNSVNKLLELGEILVVRCTLLHLLPQELDRVVVRRVGRQLKDRQPIFMFGKEGSGRLAGMILGPILNEDQMLRRLGQYLSQKRLIALRDEAIFLTMVEKASREKLNQPPDLVPLALARCLHHRRLSLERPGIAQGTPLSKADLISKQEQRLLLLR